jgi:hypothetical protein
MAKKTLATASSPAKTSATTEYIVGAAYDCAFFLLPPTFALCLGILISESAFTNTDFQFYDQDVTWAGLLIGVSVHAHLFAVFFRSHGNAAIRSLHPFRCRRHSGTSTIRRFKPSGSRVFTTARRAMTRWLAAGSIDISTNCSMLTRSWPARP